MRFATLSLLILTGLTESAIIEAEEKPARAIPTASASDRAPREIADAEEIEDYSPTRTGKSRYDWKWLAARYDKDSDGRVTRRELPLSPADFDRLDQTWDGTLTPVDFDWSADGLLCRQKETIFASSSPPTSIATAASRRTSCRL